MNHFDAVNEVAKAYNNLDYTLIDNIADDNISYESQNVLNAIEGKEQVINYLKGKFEVVRNSDNLVYAELGYLAPNESEPCIILSQGNKEDQGALILVKTNHNKVIRIDICTVAPHWSEATRTHEYPK